MGAVVTDQSPSSLSAIAKSPKSPATLTDRASGETRLKVTFPSSRTSSETGTLGFALAIALA
jgi:hypothetical protein